MSGRRSTSAFMGLVPLVLAVVIGAGCGSAGDSTTTSTASAPPNPQVQHTEQGAIDTAKEFADSFLAADGETFCRIATPSFMRDMSIDPSNCPQSLKSAVDLLNQIDSHPAYENGQPVATRNDLDYFRGIQENVSSTQVEMTANGATLTMGTPSFLFMTWDGSHWLIGSQG